MASEGKIKIKVESETSEIRVGVKETYKVEDLMKIIKRAWSDGNDYITLSHKGKQMKDDQSLSAYNLSEGSVIKVKFSADFP